MTHMDFIARNRHFWLLALCAILLLGFFVRDSKLYETPRLGATFDEFAWTWLGVSIIQTGTPTSWSPHKQYSDVRVFKHKGAYFRLVKPYLEHPPLFGLVAGSFSLFSGAKSMLDVELFHIRPLALIMGSLSIILVYILASLSFGKSVGLISALLYSVVPTVAIGSRLIQNENFFIPLWLLGLIAVYFSIKKNKKLYVLTSAVIALILVLSKIPFIAGGLSFITLYLISRKFKAAFAVFTALLIGILIYISYGIYFDKDLLFSILQLQTQRYDLTFNSIFAVFEKPYLADRFYTDGWILWGYISLFLLMLKDFKKNVYILIPFLSYFLIFMAGIPDEPGHGWYRYPFYPFLIISLALFIKEYFAKNYLLTFFFLAFIVTSLLQNVYEVRFGFSFPVFRIFILLCGLVLLPYFGKWKLAVRISVVVSYLLLIWALALSIVSGITFLD